MNNTITLSQLITQLAKTTGVDNNTARKFLRTFFATIEETLEAGQSVTINHFGTFRRGDGDDLSKRNIVVFIPDKAISDEINRPFEMFEPVELADGVVFEEQPVEQAPVFVETETVSFFDSEPTTAASEAPAETAPEPEPVIETADTAEEPEEAQEEEPVIAELNPEPQSSFTEPDPVTETEEEEIVYSEGPKKRFPIWAWALIFIIVACLIGYFAATYAVPTTPAPVPEETEITEEFQFEEVPVEDVAMSKPATEPQPAPEQLAQEPVEEPAKVAEPVYDTVEVSLIRLARKHYGVSEFWVYIFDANRDKISNPNTIRPGTRVIIPDRSTIPGSTPQEAREIAKRKQSEYQRQF